MISVIIPVCNELRHLQRTLRALVPEKDGHEVLVVDRGSRDGSVHLAKATPWVRLLKQPGSVGAAVNAAAVAAGGDVLLILFPGTTLERGWTAAVEETAAEPGFTFGAFRTAFDSRFPLYRLPEFVARLRTRLFSLPREEQALFLRRDQMLNGRVYADLEATRDFNLARRLGREGRFGFLPLSAVRPAPNLRGMPAQCLCRAATFWSFVLGRPIGDIDQGEAAREPSVLLLVESPEPARMPGWLRDAVGDDQACALYQRFAERVLDVAREAAPDRVHGFYRPARARQEVADQWGEGVRWLAQSGRGRAERRLNALREAAAGASRPVLLLDPLFPGLTPAIIRQAIRGLRRCDAVLGPDGHGGCYLVGLRPSQFDALEELAWSRKKLDHELTAALHAMKQTCHRLETRHALHGREDLAYFWAWGWIDG